MLVFVITDSRTKALEIKPPTPSEAVERMHREQCLPSISYSTFIRDQRMTSPKPKPEGEEAGASSNHLEYSGSSNNSKNIITQTNAAFEEVLGSPQEMFNLGWNEAGNLVTDIHLPRDVESGGQSTTYSNQSFSGYDNYDVPRKLAPQSTSTTYTTDIGGTFTKYVSSTRSTVPHIISYQSTACDDRVYTETTQNVNKDVILLQEFTCIPVPVGSESTACVYDVPPSHISIIPLYSSDVHSQTASLACSHSMSTSICDANTSRMPLMKPTSSPLMNMTPSTESMDNKCSPNTKQPPANLSLSELIRNHPLLKAQRDVAGIFPSDRTPSRLPRLPGGNNQESSVEYPSLNKPTCISTSLTSPVDMIMKSPSHSVQEKMQSEHVKETKTPNASSSSVQLDTDKSRPTINPHKQQSPTCSSHEEESVEYSQVVHASMNRAQTLKARNIQELKKLDCQKVRFVFQ